MEEGLKKRLIGAAVLASLAVIFVPMLFEEPPPVPPSMAPIPERPPARDFASEMLREEVAAITPLAPEREVERRPAEKPAAKPATKPRAVSPAWIVQAASLSTRERAERLVKALRKEGLPTPNVATVEIRGKRRFRVMVGPVVEKREAEAMIDRVSRVAGTKAQVKTYP